MKRFTVFFKSDCIDCAFAMSIPATDHAQAYETAKEMYKCISFCELALVDVLSEDEVRDLAH